MITEAQLPTLDTVLGRQTERLRGIKSWHAAATLGSTNLKRLVELAQENARALMLDDNGAREELKAVREAIAFFHNALVENPADKPLLPRLRVESFRIGEPVMVYVGDSGGAHFPTPWLAGSVTEITKSYKAEWSEGTRNTGYYWRVTASLPSPIYAGGNTLAFSTTEPRVIPQADFVHLVEAVANDLLFVRIYGENARRSWHPLWCLEHSTKSLGDMMDMEASLTQYAQTVRG